MIEIVVPIKILTLLLQVLKESFLPQVAPRVRVWIDEAEAEGWLPDSFVIQGTL